MPPPSKAVMEKREDGYHWHSDGGGQVAEGPFETNTDALLDAQDRGMACDPRDFDMPCKVSEREKDGRTYRQKRLALAYDQAQIKRRKTLAKARNSIERAVWERRLDEAQAGESTTLS